MGVLSYQHANIGSEAEITAMVFVTIATSLAVVKCARAPYRADVIEQESKARVRDAALNKRISANEANAIVNDEDPEPDRILAEDRGPNREYDASLAALVALAASPLTSVRQQRLKV